MEYIEIKDDQVKLKNEYYDIKTIGNGVITYFCHTDTYPRTRGVIYYCQDTFVCHPAWFMLDDRIWNVITPDFEDVDENGVHKGILSIDACNERCKEYLYRPLRLSDFKKDDERNQIIYFMMKNIIV